MVEVFHRIPRGFCSWTIFRASNFVCPLTLVPPPTPRRNEQVRRGLEGKSNPLLPSSSLMPEVGIAQPKYISTSSNFALTSVKFSSRDHWPSTLQSWNHHRTVKTALPKPVPCKHTTRPSHAGNPLRPHLQLSYRRCWLGTILQHPTWCVWCVDGRSFHGTNCKGSYCIWQIRIRLSLPSGLQSPRRSSALSGHEVECNYPRVRGMSRGSSTTDEPLPRACGGEQAIGAGRWSSWFSCQELFRLRNWYRFSALLIALREAHFDESTLPSYFDLLDPNNNFAAFRAHMAAQPGLPFLLPYVKQYAIRGEETALGEVFQFLLYNPEAVLAQSGCSTRDYGVLRYLLPCIYGR